MCANIDSLNSLCDHQGIKLQILNCAQGRSGPPLLLQHPPLSPPHLPFPTTPGFLLAPPPGRGRGGLGPAPKEIWRTPPQQLSRHVEGPVTPKFKAKYSRRNPFPASRLWGMGRRPAWGPHPPSSLPPPTKNKPTQKRTKTTLNCLIVTVYPGIILKQL